MKKLAATLALSLIASALAGGSGPRPDASLAVGQVWQMTATTKTGLSVGVQMRLSSKIPSDIIKGSSPVYIYATESILGGGNMNFTPKKYGIDATIVMDKTNILRCFAQATASGQSASGYLLQGTSEGTNSQLTEAQTDTDFSREALLQGIKRVGNGTCTLKRLR